AGHRLDHLRDREVAELRLHLADGVERLLHLLVGVDGELPVLLVAGEPKLGVARLHQRIHHVADPWHVVELRARRSTLRGLWLRCRRLRHGPDRRGRQRGGEERSHGSLAHGYFTPMAPMIAPMMISTSK